MLRGLAVMSLAVALVPAPAPDAGDERVAGPKQVAAVAPVSGQVTRRFDPPRTPYGAGHRGVDLSARPGEPVAAAMAGTVTFSGTVAGVGWVTVDHGGHVRTTYGPLSPRVVSAHGVVQRGDVVGFVAPGATHLDWGARLDDAYIDPLGLLAGWETYLVDGDDPGLPAFGGLPLNPARAAGSMRWPVTAPVTSAFGQRVHPVTGDLRHHAGLDIAGPTGAVVRAAAAGTVTFAGEVSGYGNTVVIDHGSGTSTLYAHLDRITTTTEDAVPAGAGIGAVGASGTATGPHLHFEVRRGGVAVDPLPLLTR